jgi:hypothetical protein
VRTHESKSSCRRLPGCAFPSGCPVFAAPEVSQSLMEDDLVASLTRQVKEDVIENYLLERRIIELQIESLNAQADETRRQAWMVGRRLARLSSLMIHTDMQNRLAQILRVGSNYFWTACLNVQFKRHVRLIRVRSLTFKGKFRKLVRESCARLYYCMSKYKRKYEDLACERIAVNSNIDSFHKNFDLLSILNFIRGLDMRGIEKKKILGDNFTAKEMAELDKNLYIAPISMEKLDAPAPLELPEFGSIRQDLTMLADEILQKYGTEVKRVIL